MKAWVKPFALALGVVVLSVGPPSSDGWTGVSKTPYRRVTATYLTVAGVNLDLDVYARVDASGPQPTLIWFHGGGWTEGSKADAMPYLLPYMQLGWNVVNVEYRLARVSPAPAAVEDSLCALRWVIRHAEEYGFATDRIVVSGESAGGHLALTTAMIPASERLDGACPGSEPLKIAAVVDWFGVSDVADLLEGPNRRGWALRWLAGQPHAAEVARRVSPLTHVRRGVPPVIAIHGDADLAVPFSHSARLVRALQNAQVDAELVTVPGGGHGRFSWGDNQRVYERIRSFLDRQGLVAPVAAR